MSTPLREGHVPWVEFYYRQHKREQARRHEPLDNFNMPHWRYSVKFHDDGRMTITPRWFIKQRRNIQRVVIFVAVMAITYYLFGTPIGVVGAAITSAGTGDGSAGATWVGGVAPVSGDDAIIANTHNVTIDVDGELWGSCEVQNGGTLTFTSGYKLVLDGENAGGKVLDPQAGSTFTAANGTVEITTADTTNIDIDNGAGNLYNLIINNGGNVVSWTGSGTTTIDNDLTLTAGTMRSSNAGGSITVTGNADVTGTLGASGRSGAWSFGSLTVQSGGTYSATSGTTTITSEAGNIGFYLYTGGTFTHNSGTISCTYNGDTVWRAGGALAALTFYNFTVDTGAAANQLSFRNADLTIAGNLVINDGELELSDDNSFGTLVVTGTTTIGDGAGAASSAKLVCNSSTVVLTGNWTVDTDGELSLPDASGSFTAAGTPTVKGVITHNDGKVTLNLAGNYNMALHTNVILYDLEITTGKNFSVVPHSDDRIFTVENTLTCVHASSGFRPRSEGQYNLVIIIGTTTSAGTIDTTACTAGKGVQWYRTSTGDTTIRAADSNHPVRCIGTDWDWDAFSTTGCIIQDIDYRIAATTGGGGVTVTMTRCKFPLGMHVSSGDVVKIAGNTASGFLKMEGDGKLQIVRGGGVYTLDGIGDDRPAPKLPTVLNPANICPKTIEGVDS